MAETAAEFRHYQCWKRDRVQAVVNLEAERAERDTFLAVHTDRPLQVASARAGGDEDRRFAEWTADGFKDAFLAETDRNISAVVVGNSGTGKSHFIKWLSMHIEDTPDRIVLTIPKSGTSLRRIIEMLLDRLPAALAAKYRATLEGHAFEDQTSEGRRRALAAYIALELGRRTPSRGNKKEGWLLPGRLPLLFQDVHIVNKKLIRDGGLLHRLVDHVGERLGPGATDVPHEFALDDLPRAGADIREAAAETQAVLRLLTGDDEMEAAAVALVNDVLGAAIARAVAFPPDRLFEVMLNLRRYLAVEGKELILLIEDFARLQGIDGGLLQALIEDGGRGTDLCVLRWCMAITSGPFETKVRQTVKTRLTLEVDMTQSAAALAPGGPELAAFAGQYMNAMRLPGDVISEWVSRGAVQPVPSACTGCTFRESCHATFGASHGIGLYPFTEQALTQIHRLINPSGDFNPRKFIKGVLKPTFADHDLDWKSPASFPSGSYHRDLGGPDGSRITNPRLLSIQERYPTDTDRYVALFDLWGDQDLRVDPVLARAFNLTVIDGPPPPPPKPAEKGPEVEDYGLSQADRRLIDALNAWGAGGELEDGAVNPLRKLLFEALEARVDWDRSAITPGFFLRGDVKSYFRPANISFRRQLLATTPGDIQIQIPALDVEQDYLRASIALQALVVLSAGGRFRKDDGPQGMAQLGAHLEAWSTRMVDQLRGVAQRLGPVEDACEVLLYRAALSGRHYSTRAAWIDGAFLVEAGEVQAPSTAWQSLYDDLREENTQARQFVRALTSASKGGQARAIIDPRPMLAALQRMQAGAVDGSSGPRDPGSSIARAMSHVRRSLPGLLGAEAARQRSWRDGYRANLAGATSFAELRTAMDDLNRELIRCGIPFSRAKASAAFDALSQVSANFVDKTERAISEWGNAVSLAQVADPDHWAAIRAWEIALPRVVDFLNEVDASVGRNSDIEAISETIQRTEAQVEPLLMGLVAVAAELEAQG